MNGRTAFLCDFDGTISPQDIGAAFVKRFSGGRQAELRELLKRWLAGTLGSRALIEAECALLRVREREAIEFARTFELDPAFGAFVGDAQRRGDHVLVVSDGFGFYVADHLERSGLSRVPHVSNRMRFEGERAIPEFPWGAGGCGACGNCKAQHVRRLAAEGYRTVLVGDGFSDRCGARTADVVLARDALLEWCEREGVAATPFRDFADVAEWAREERAVG